MLAARAVRLEGTLTWLVGLLARPVDEHVEDGKAGQEVLRPTVEGDGMSQRLSKLLAF